MTRTFRSWLNPKQSVIVTVESFVKGTAGSGYRNLMTFSVLGPENAQKTAAMQVGNSRTEDNEDPRLWHRYTSDCTNVILGSCEDATWAIEVTAQDRESGIYFVYNFTRDQT